MKHLITDEHLAIEIKDKIEANKKKEIDDARHNQQRRDEMTTAIDDLRDAGYKDGDIIQAMLDLGMCDFDDLI